MITACNTSTKRALVSTGSDLIGLHCLTRSHAIKSSHSYAHLGSKPTGYSSSVTCVNVIGHLSRCTSPVKRMGMCLGNNACQTLIGEEAPGVQDDRGEGGRSKGSCVHDMTGGGCLSFFESVIWPRSFQTQVWYVGTGRAGSPCGTSRSSRPPCRAPGAFCSRTPPGVGVPAQYEHAGPCLARGVREGHGAAARTVSALPHYIKVVLSARARVACPATSARSSSA